MDTPVDIKKMYLDHKKAGLSSKDAAKLVQLKTGRSAVTGVPLNRFKTRTAYRGQYQ